MSRLGLNLLLAGFVLFFTQCVQDSPDNTPPAVEFLSFTPQPTADEVCGATEPTVFHVLSGDTLRFRARFTDDEGLSQYKIDIHSNFDCHGHKDLTEEWSVLDIQDLQGLEQTVERGLPVPDYVTAGAYHFQIQVIDQAGNEDPFASFFSIKVLNDTDTIPPVLTLNEPNIGNGSLNWNKGETITFRGRVTDNFSLFEGGNGKLVFTYRSESSGNLFTWDEPFAFPETAGKDYEFAVDREVPATVQPGEFTIFIDAFDGVNNAAAQLEFSARISN